jgi:hypothetical protein
MGGRYVYLIFMAPYIFLVGCVLATILAYIFEIHCNLADGRSAHVQPQQQQQQR